MRRHLPLVVVALSLCGCISAAETAQRESADRGRVLDTARTIIRDAGFATLITVSEDGQPQARIMDPASPDQEFVVWIATKSSTRKVAQIRKNPRATLIYFDTSTLSYVTLLGTASLVADPAEKERRWKAEWAPFYPGGAKSEDLVLIRFEPGTVEVVSEHYKIVNDPDTWRPVSVNLN